MKRLPFFSVTGPTGVGKSTVCRRLWELLPDCVVLDGDLLWEPRLWDDVDFFYERWLRVASEVSQSGRPVVLCTAAMPDAWERQPSRTLLGDVHMMALVCDERVLRGRLAEREPFDDGTPPTFVEDTVTFNRWLREHVEHVDTGELPPELTAAHVADWVRARL